MSQENTQVEEHGGEAAAHNGPPYASHVLQGRDDTVDTDSH